MDYSYRTGSVPFRALQRDPRFSYALFVPQNRDSWEGRPIVVPVHGTDRIAQTFRDRFAPLAKSKGLIVLSPLFPAGIGDPDDLDDYKLLTGHGIRYDELLLDMIEEVCGRYGCDRKLLLYGFSGGAQFVHRFAMLYPELLLGISIAAPGLVTLPGEESPWWAGCRNVEKLFGKAPRWERLARVPVQMLVGEEDTDTEEITLPPHDPLWVEGAGTAGSTRIERLASLRDAWREKGVPVDWQVFPGIGHDDEELWKAAERFFSKVTHNL